MAQNEGSGPGSLAVPACFKWSSWSADLKESLLDIFVGMRVRPSDLKEDKNGKPTPKSLDLLEDALGLAPDDAELRFQYIQVLGDLLIEHSRKFDEVDYVLGTAEEEIKFGTRKIFGSAKHLRDYILEQSLKLFELDPISVKFNIKIATLFEAALPYWARNVPFAKLCLERALIFHPESSKALTKMGKHVLNTNRDLNAARDYFRRAVHCNQEDEAAVTCYLYTLFENIKDYKDLVCPLLKDYLGKEHWSKEQRARLLFIRGLFQFFFENLETNVAISWTKSVAENKSEFEACLQRFNRVKSLYKFPLSEDVFTLTNFCSVLKDASMIPLPGVDSEKLKLVRNIIKGIGRKEAKDCQTRKAERIAKSLRPTRKVCLPPNEVLQSLLLGSQDKDDISEAFKLFGISENSPKMVVNDKFKRACRDLESIKREPHDSRDVKNQQFQINSAFVTLHRHCERQARNAASASSLKNEDAEEIDMNSLEDMGYLMP